MSDNIIAPKGRLSFPHLFSPAERIERLQAELRAMGLKFERAADLARQYERLARARSPEARHFADTARADYDKRVRAGEAISPREHFKVWFGACRAALRDFPHSSRFNHSGFDITCGRHGIYRPIFGADKYFRVNPEAARVYYRDFDQACRATGKQFKRLEVSALRTLRETSSLTARLPK